jgi:hypothetical protein
VFPSHDRKGGDKTVTSGTFTIEFPAASAGTAIIGIA